MTTRAQAEQLYNRIDQVFRQHHCAVDVTMILEAALLERELATRHEMMDVLMAMPNMGMHWRKAFEDVLKERAAKAREAQ